MTTLERNAPISARRHGRRWTGGGVLASLVAASLVTVIAACNVVPGGGPATATARPPGAGEHVTPDSPTDPILVQPTFIPSDTPVP